MIKERGQYRRITERRQEESEGVVKKVEVCRGCAPRSVEYQSTPSMSRGDDQMTVASVTVPVNHGPESDGATGGTCTHTLLDMSQTFELFELPWHKEISAASLDLAGY